MRLIEQLAQRLDEWQELGLARTRQVVGGPCRPHQELQGQSVLSFNSNDYLGLANHPQVLAAMQEGLARYGVGSGASHLVSGHNQAHQQLEERLADLYQPYLPQAKALSMCTGYMANLAVLSALASGSDSTEIFSDALNHASIIDGARLSRAKVSVYPHLQVQMLAQQLQASPATMKLVVTDSVFSMDGTVAPLPELLAVCERHGAWLVVDDAHGFGVLGERGLGALEHFGLHAEQLILMGTLGKSAGVAGAFIAAHATVVDYLVQRARPYIYTTASPPALAHALLTSLDIITGPSGQALRVHLQHLLQVWQAAAGSFFRVSSDLTSLPVLLPSPTPIQPLVMGSNEVVLQVSRALMARGVWVSAIRAPTVPAGTARLRITFSAAHTLTDVHTLLHALQHLPTYAPMTQLDKEFA